ncbi:MAG: type II secretion system protein M [Gammaproteobacteria bacterium]|nr:type II secretion system protein M [Gammaproteobacteria bacterium]
MASALENFKRNALHQLEQSSLYKSSSTWFNQLSERDQKFVKAIGVIFTIALLFAWVWQPVSQGKEKAESKYYSELKFHQKMKDSAHLFGGVSTNAPTSGASILSTVNNTAKVKNIQLKRFEPEGENGLRIWLDKANFNSVIDWLELLETSRGIRVEQISIDKVDSGIVNVRAVLQS